MAQIRSTQNTPEILAELGARLRALRVQQNLTTTDLAAQAGVSARTDARAETGASTTLENIVKILRPLGRIEALESFLPAPLISPLQLVERAGKPRQRAYAPRPSRRREGDK
jgi:transcriptional regulator with XRE-family HTH domain